MNYLYCNRWVSDKNSHVIYNGICPIPKWTTDVLCYFGEHSTNIWLVHMFFYGSLFGGLAFRVKYPIPVFLLLLALSLAASYGIKWLCKPILKLVR